MAAPGYAQYGFFRDRPLTQEEWLALQGIQQPRTPMQPQSSGLDPPVVSGYLLKQALSGSGSVPTPSLPVLESFLEGGLSTVPSTTIGSAGGTMFASGASYAGEAIGTAANGGTLMSTGAIVPASEGAPVGSAMGAGGGLGSCIPGIAGTIGMYDLLKNKRRGPRGVIQGGASGAGIGWTLGGPVGAGIGAVVGSGIGLSQAKKSTKEIESDRWKKTGREDLGQARKGQDYFAGTGGEKSRDERFLTPSCPRGASRN